MRSFYLICFLWLVPFLAFAACSENGATIVYVNGIFTSEDKARKDLRNFHMEFIKAGGDSGIKFINGYNPSHVQGWGDLIKSIQQAYWDKGSLIEDTDMRTILLQLYPEITTQKILLVGHSQGTFYANELYKYLTSHGVPENSIGVFNVATPADYVAGNGEYLTSATDKVINKVRAAVRKAPSIESFGAGAVLSSVEQHQPKAPLPSNIVLALNLKEQKDENGGHSFSDVYLDVVPSIIIDHVASGLSKLSATPSRVEGDCFSPPTKSLSYETGKASLAVLDFLADKTEKSIEKTISSGTKAGTFVKSFALDVATTVSANVISSISKVASDVSVTAGGVQGLSHAANPDEAVTNFKLFKAVYGSSLSESDIRELLGQNQGSAAILALDTSPPPAPQPQAPLIPAPPPMAAPIPGGGASSPTAHEELAVTEDATPSETVDTGSGGGGTTEDSTEDTPPPEDSASQDDTASSTPAEDTTGDDAASTTPELTAAELMAANPPVLTFSNWDTIWSGESYCAAVTRTFDISWSAVPGATSYEVWWKSNTNVSNHLALTAADTTGRGFTVPFGLGADQITTWVTARDSAGNSVTATTSLNDVLPDSVRPTAEPVSPAIGATNVSTNASLVWRAGEPVATSSVPGAFYLRKIGTSPAGSLTWFPVDSTAALGSDGTTVTMTPAAPLEYGTGYWVTVSCTLKDLYGNHPAFNSLFLSNNTRYFTTEAEPVIATTTATSTP